MGRLLLADPAPQLLLPDESTHNLDQETMEQLFGALRSYGGGLVVVSHDEGFLRDLDGAGGPVRRLWQLQRAADASPAACPVDVGGGAD
ncbi:MAG TPA: hypothetical protein VN621_04395 [Arthrobacter sp.]|nr:hypothetical protein [Arthrobacter sp.]